MRLKTKVTREHEEFGPSSVFHTWLQLAASACSDIWHSRRPEAQPSEAMTTRPSSYALDDPAAGEALARMGPRRFEILVQLLFEKRGVTMSARNTGKDPGLDIWIYRADGGGPPIDLVQCRHWPGKRIGVDKVQALWSEMKTHRLPCCRLATSASFTEEAVAFALDHGIELIDAEALAAMIAANPAALLLAGPALSRVAASPAIASMYPGPRA